MQNVKCSPYEFSVYPRMLKVNQLPPPHHEGWMILGRETFTRWI
jgi:hypothetical protein